MSASRRNKQQGPGLPSMIEEIDKFDGRYGFLSNFYPARITYMGMHGATLEHVYQASKATSPMARATILACETAGQAKRKGARVKLRDDWTEETRIVIMLDLLRLKFAIPGLRKQLLDTGSAWLVEGNTWGDEFWGVCRGRGKNILGLLLMQVRAEIKAAT
jgi:ribA/ribD-fused uncharacterized protein